jgi:hypothetical protein
MLLKQPHVPKSRQSTCPVGHRSYASSLMARQIHGVIPFRDFCSDPPPPQHRSRHEVGRCPASSGRRPWEFAGGSATSGELSAEHSEKGRFSDLAFGGLAPADKAVALHAILEDP